MNDTKIIESPKEFWKATRNNEYLKSTSGVAPGYVQTNLAVLPKEYAFDFLLFC